jgi:hypothetical protein
MRLLVFWFFRLVIVPWCWLCFGAGHALCWLAARIDATGYALRGHVLMWRRLLNRH